MIDLILIKTIEHALRALNPPSAGCFILECIFGNYIYSAMPTRIKYSQFKNYVTISFPIGTTRYLDTIVAGVIHENTGSDTFSTESIIEMRYL
jgi:hypothetical protein